MPRLKYSESSLGKYDDAGDPTANNNFISEGNLLAFSVVHGGALRVRSSERIK